jgi:hypothetical protein
VVRQTIATLVVSMVCTAPALAQSPAATTGHETKAGDRETKTLNLSAYVELLRYDVRTQKVAILTELMAFSEAEDRAFWPIYREYDLEMAKLGDERVALITEYAGHYPKVTDAIADKIAAKALDLEARRQATKARCYERVKAALSPVTALRFLHIEHQMLLLIDLQISASLPVVHAASR